MNYCGVVQRNKSTIYICGGINSKLDEIKNTFLIFNPETLALQLMPPMKNVRYTFPMIYHNNRLYVMGGRVYGADQTSLLWESEYFDFEQKKWIDMPNMNKRRCTSMAFVAAHHSGVQRRDLDLRRLH